MNSGVLPPVPDLIPISVLRKNSSENINSPNSIGCSQVKRVSSVSVSAPEVMGEQRSRRRSSNQAPVKLIDSSGSRGASAAPQALHSRKARSERHRKSDRRREHGKPARTDSSGSKHSKSRERNRPESSSPERPLNPRVNPIFVWVRQEDTHIVEVKCEDYDKRNRILLTKTAQGWRAIPRTETLVPSLKEAASTETQHHHHHNHHKHKKSRKNKIRRRSTGVQVSSDIEPEKEDAEAKDINIEAETKKSTSQVNDIHNNSPSWISPENINVESLLPSHTITVKRSTSPNKSPERDTNVNSVVREAQTSSANCNADKICDVTPLDNLLAVAELEFNQQIQSGEWNKTNETDVVATEDVADSFDKTFGNDSDDVDHKDFIKDLEQLNDLIESEENKLELQNEYEPHQIKSECDYNDEDENNLAMDDILSRLEQSLRSPDYTEIHTRKETFSNKNEEDEDIKNIEEYVNETESDLKSIPELDKFFEEVDNKMDVASDEQEQEKVPEETCTDLHKEQTHEIEVPGETSSDEAKSHSPPEESEKPEIIDLVETTMEGDDEPRDLSLKPTSSQEHPVDTSDHEEPTDLSIQKPPSFRPLTPLRPPSQSSEAIQSPQPSGIPAVPQSPDTVSTSISNTSISSCKSKSIFLESLLSSSTKKIALNSEVTIIRQKEPIDLGNSRKSASPTVTCSEEINNTHCESEPPAKKIKTVDITLKTLLDTDVEKCVIEEKTGSKSPENSRLLELLNSDDYIDPLTQLKQLLADGNINVPDPMLVPKDRFTQILTNPATEIPKLLKERPELRLPDALAYPHIMQDPNMLVLNIHHLQSILSNKHALEVHNNRPSNEKNQETPTKKNEKVSEITKEPTIQFTKKKPVEAATKSATKEPQDKHMNELANDIDVATQAAFNQMMWLPYLNHLEAMSLSNNADFMKSFSNSLPFPLYPNQMPDISHMFAANRFPPSPVTFPMQSPLGYGNPMEFNMWQEAMIQANLLRSKNNFDSFSSKQMFKEYLEKMNGSPLRKPFMANGGQKAHTTHKQPNYPNNIFPNDHTFQNQYFNMPSMQCGSSRQNSQLPSYTSPSFHHKSLMNQQKHENNFVKKPLNAYQPHQRLERMVDNNQNYSNVFSQLSDLEKSQYMQNMNIMSNQEQYHYNASHNQRKESNGVAHKPKLACKPFANLSHSNQKSASHHDQQQKEKNNSSGSESCKQQTSQPIDLSGSTTSGSKLKVKQHLIDPMNTPKLLKHHDDVPEVGSTTTSIEEMQDAHKHLWHPLFGK